MSKCEYCHENAGDKLFVENFRGTDSAYCCSETYQKKTTDYINFENKYKYLFFALILGSILMIVVASSDAVTFGALVILGITLVIFPFCNPMTMQMLGIKKSKIAARVVGLILIIGGLTGFISSSFR